MARTVSRTESYIGYCILLLLVVVAGGVFLRQYKYSPAILKPGELKKEIGAGRSSDASRAVDLSQFAPEGLIVLSAGETFGPENLSDKINGKAELYLSAGFAGLVTQRFALKDDPGVWKEVFVYDMASIKGSFAVFSLQRRSGAENLDLSEFSYRTENGLFFVHGRYYVEMIASVTQGKMADLMLAFARSFIDRTVVSQERLKELAFLPSESLNRESISLIPSNGFGYHRLDSMVTAEYNLAETDLTVFLSQRESQAEAAELVEAYVQFLLDNGGVEVQSSLEIPGVKLVEILGSYEAVFSQGSMLAGIHQAEKKEAAERLVIKLQRKLSEG